MLCLCCGESDPLSSPTFAYLPLACSQAHHPKHTVILYADTFPVILPTTATGLTATGILHLPRRPAARMSATVTMPPAEGSQQRRPRATLVT